MANTNYLVFDQNQTNILSDEAYQNDIERLDGMTQGISRSILFNKVLLQSSALCYAIARVAVDRGFDMIDTDSQGLYNAMSQAFPINRGLPVGLIVPTTAPITVAPEGFLLPDGKSFDPSKYPELANLYRQSDGSYFYGSETKASGAVWPRTPNCLGSFIRILNPGTSGDDANRLTGSKQEANVGKHNHIFRASTAIGSNSGGSNQYIGGYVYASSAERRMWRSDYNVNNMVAVADNNNITDNRPVNYAFTHLIIAASGFNLSTFGGGSGSSFEEIPLTIQPEVWVSSEGNITYTLTVEGADFSNSSVDFGLPSPTTRNNANAVQMAQIIIESVYEDTITLSCASVPATEVSLTIRVWSK